MLKKVETSVILETNSDSNYNMIEVNKNLINILKEIELIIEYLFSDKE